MDDPELVRTIWNRERKFPTDFWFPWLAKPNKEKGSPSHYIFSFLFKILNKYLVNFAKRKSKKKKKRASHRRKETLIFMYISFFHIYFLMYDHWTKHIKSLSTFFLIVFFLIKESSPKLGEKGLIKRLL